MILALVGAAEVTCLLDFPPGFKFGSATSAYQIEGAWNVSDKGESIWDHLLHTRPDFTSDSSNGDVACDSYHRWEEDLQLIEDLGVDFYRFSIAWPRLLPSGFTDVVSEDGRRYYSMLIDGLRARRVEPVVTLYHWDLPQSIQDLGGWTNPLIVDWFADYARVVFTLFADQDVKAWITINEPMSICDAGYRSALAPAFEDPDVGVLLCSKYILLAHAKAYRIYEKEFKPIYGGEVSLANHELWYEPETDLDWDITALTRDYIFGRYTHPIYSAEGGWPPAVEKYIADKSKEEGYPRSRLPAFTPEEIELMKDKGESIWDHLLHTRPDFTSDSSNGDVACDSYHRWEEDLQLIEDLGVDFYRFSIAWPRLLPSGFTDVVSEDGRRYYSMLIDGLRARRVEPVVTLYHWNLPQSIQDLGGWTNPLIVDWFADYARVVFTLFADQDVKAWITINEPMSICDAGYRSALAPAFEDPDVGVLLCSKYILLAHAKAYRIYEKEFKPIYGGEVSLANHELWYEPETDLDWDITALTRDYIFGRYTHPIYSAEGGWPPAVEKYIADKSKEEGYPRSRLPAFTPEEIELMKGSYDFFALNHYTSRTVRAALPGEEIGSFLVEGIKEVGAVMGSRQHWESGTSTSSWIKVDPEGLRNNLRQIKQQYGNVSIMITENGFSDSGGNLNDAERVLYYQEYLKQVLLAITEDGVNVVGYTAWSLMDNFEWSAGYTSRFGLYAVDFSGPRRRRSPKASARYYRRVVRARSLDVQHVAANPYHLG